MKPDYDDATADLQGQRVRVYYNFHRHLWSVQTWDSDKTGWRVHGYARRIELLRARFEVSLAGCLRVRKTRRKNVHAYVVGVVPTVGTRVTIAYPERVRYNPYDMDQFQDLDGNAVRMARCAVMEDGRVWVGGKNMA